MFGWIPALCQNLGMGGGTAAAGGGGNSAVPFSAGFRRSRRLTPVERTLPPRRLRLVPLVLELGRVRVELPKMPAKPAAVAPAVAPSIAPLPAIAPPPPSFHTFHHTLHLPTLAPLAFHVGKPVIEADDTAAILALLSSLRLI